MRYPLSLLRFHFLSSSKKHIIFLPAVPPDPDSFLLMTCVRNRVLDLWHAYALRGVSPY